jgi:hypothetical protein
MGPWEKAQSLPGLFTFYHIVAITLGVISRTTMPQAQDHPHLHPPVRTHKMQLVTKGRLKFCKHGAMNQELAVEDWVKALTVICMGANGFAFFSCSIGIGGYFTCTTRNRTCQPITPWAQSLSLSVPSILDTKTTQSRKNPHIFIKVHVHWSTIVVPHPKLLVFITAIEKVYRK